MSKAIDDATRLECDSLGFVTVDGIKFEPHEYMQSSLALQVAILRELRYANRRQREESRIFKGVERDKV